MAIIGIIVGTLLGILAGLNAGIIPYIYSKYLAIGIMAALDSVFGGISSSINGKFDLKIFVSGFFGNAILSIILTYLGQKLDLDIFLAAVFVFVYRMFINFAIIRRYYLDKIIQITKKRKRKSGSKNNTN